MNMKEAFSWNYLKKTIITNGINKLQKIKIKWQNK